MGWYYFKPYVSASQRRAKALQLSSRLRKQGQALSPIEIAGRAIATTFWGKAWCDHLESYSDFENRLPRGRTYVRNGSVIDLQISAGKIAALVSGSDIYKVTIEIKKLKPALWAALKSRCAGRVGSVLELLQGRFAKSVMEILTHRQQGMFPEAAEISMNCSCPDWADMCKHVAAVLYGVGARVDHQPELLFVLRNVNHLELLDRAAAAGGLVRASSTKQDAIAETELSAIFGIDMEPAAPLGTGGAERSDVLRQSDKGASKRGRRAIAVAPSTTAGAANRAAQGARSKRPAGKGATGGVAMTAKASTAKVSKRAPLASPRRKRK